ncbi:MAG: DMT family transporter [Burkholderiaceae bacterium]|nr:DMT family transporter [Burkholderiaceae bacterium]
MSFCALCWSTAGGLVRLLDRQNGIELTFLRSLFCALAVFALLAWRWRANPLKPVIAMGWPGLISGVMWAIMFTAFTLAITLTTVANTLLVLSLAPFFAAVLGWLVLRQQVVSRTWVAMSVAGFGIWWMVRHGISSEGYAGMTIALACPLASAVNFVTLRKIHTRIDLMPAVLVGALISLLVMAPFALPFAPSPRDVAIIAFLGVFQLALPSMLLVRATRFLSPHEVALIALLEMVLAPLWAWMFGGEVMSIATIQGGLLVVGALVANEFFGTSRAAATVGPT